MSKNTILIVDDVGPDIAVLDHLLSDEYETFSAIDGPTAIELALRHLPDLILLDVIMPGMNGYAVLSKLKALQETKDIPVIFVSGLSGINDEKKGLALGAADYICKPFSDAIVKLRVASQMEIVNSQRTIKHLTEVAEESSRSKSRFLARMSHEIRTPITAVMGFSELQLRKHSMPPQTEAVFVKILDSSKTLLNIVNDILDFSKIESGHMPLVTAEYDVSSLINDASQLHVVYLEGKTVVFQLSVDENLPAKLIGDALRIRQVINNLLTNAFKYTDTGTVRLSFSYKESGLEMIVQDTGIGMSEEQLERLSGDYVRLHEQEKHFVNGTGLGIPIVYSLAKIMNAEVKIESQVGIGTCVTVFVPQEVQGEAVLGRELADSLEKFDANTWSLSADLGEEQEQMPYGKVLVVDDVDSNLIITEAMLEVFGVCVELCRSAREAITKIKQGNIYDIIFLDYMMPEMNGIEATKVLRAMGYNEPIVALTANAIKGEDEMFMSNGFSGFMSKPLDFNRLKSYLVRFISNKHIEN